MRLDLHIMVMRPTEPVVAYCMQISIYNFTGETFVTLCIYRMFYHDCGLLCVYWEIMASARIRDIHKGTLNMPHDVICYVIKSNESRKIAIPLFVVPHISY